MTDIPEDHIRLECDHHPPGGQHVGMLTGVTVTHIPSGISVHVDCGQSQHRNKQIAMDALLGALTSPWMR